VHQQIQRVSGCLTFSTKYGGCNMGAYSHIFS